MKVALLFFMTALLVAGCTKTSNEQGILNGKYSGTFHREQGIGNKETANVSITFSANTFSGVSEKPRYPAICGGSYSVNSNQIRFANGCIWTADFDGTLILDHDYSLRLNGDSVEIKREYAGQMTDIYKLKKE